MAYLWVLLGWFGTASQIQRAVVGMQRGCWKTKMAFFKEEVPVLKTEPQFRTMVPSAAAFLRISETFFQKRTRTVLYLLPFLDGSKVIGTIPQAPLSRRLGCLRSETGWRERRTSTLP